MWEQVEQMRIRYGLGIVLTGFGLAALVSVLAIFRWNDATNVSTAISATTSLVGAVANAFLGLGRTRGEGESRGRSRAVGRDAPGAIAMLPPESANQLRVEIRR